MLKEVCVIDGNFNDEHTPQHRNCDDDCPLFQIHHFTDNASGSCIRRFTKQQVKENGTRTYAND